MTKDFLEKHGFKPLTLNDRDLYCSFLGSTRVLDLCFPALLAYWDSPMYRIRDGVMLVCVNETDGYISLPPMGDFGAGILQLRGMGLPPIGYMTRRQADMCGLETNCDKRFSDYIVMRQEMTALSWKYKHKLADYNYFIKHYAFSVKEITPELHNDCRAVLEQWCGGRSCSDCLFGCEKPVLERYLAGMPQSGASGLLVYIDNKPVGNLIAALQGDSLFYPYAKTDKAFSGLSVFMYVYFASMHSVPYVNLGSDGGIEGIRHFKNKFRPYTLSDKWFYEGI